MKHTTNGIAVGDKVKVVREHVPWLFLGQTFTVSAIGKSSYMLELVGLSDMFWAPEYFELVVGADKQDSAKPDLSLVPLVALVAEAKAFQVGERKYGRYNYCKGHKASQLVAAAQRHLLAWFGGEENDPVDGQSHLGSVRACMAMLLRQQELGTLKDDRYKPEEQ